MARAYVLQGLLSSKVLWARRNVQSPVFIDISGMVAHVIGIVVIGDWVNDIYIDTLNGADYFHEAIEAHPCIVVDVDAEILGNGEAAEGYSAKSISLVQLMHSTAWHVDPEVTRDREHRYLFGGRVDSHDNIGLGQ